MKIRTASGRRDRGFTLVELLIVMAILGIITTAIYSSYENASRTSQSQDSIVELQQNLRVAMDQLTRDIQYAGFLLPPPPAENAIPISVAEADNLTLQTASVNGEIARISIANPVASPPAATTEIDLTVGSEDMADFFTSSVTPANADWVRIIRPSNSLQPLNDTFQISDKDRTVPKLVLKDFSAGGVSIENGDMIVKVPTSGSSLPGFISFALNGTDLHRIVTIDTNGDGTPDPITDQILASNIAAVQFRYLLDDESEVDTVAGDTRYDIRAVRVTLTAVAVATTTQSAKNRELESVIALRNR